MSREKTGYIFNALCVGLVLGGYYLMVYAVCFE